MPVASWAMPKWHCESHTCLQRLSQELSSTLLNPHAHLSCLMRLVKKFPGMRSHLPVPPHPTLTGSLTTTPSDFSVEHPHLSWHHIHFQTLPARKCAIF